MFVSKNQFFIFLACLSFGGFSGMLLSLIYGVKYFIKNKVVKIILDIISCSILGALFVIYSYKIYFPNFRIYMFFGVVVGLYLYLKSFHILLANFCKKIYNIIEQKYRGAKEKWKKKTNFQKKRQKSLSSQER